MTGHYGAHYGDHYGSHYGVVEAGDPPDETLPEVVGAYITTTTLYVPFTEAVNGSGTGISVVPSGDAMSLGSVSGANGTLLRQFPVSRPPVYGETFTITISSSNIEDLAGNGLADDTEIPVENRVPDPDAPVGRSRGAVGFVVRGCVS